MKLGKGKLFTISFFLLFVVLGYVSPVLADYLGPERTISVTTTDCEVVLWSCQWVEAKSSWKYKQSSFWSCSSESKPWQQYPSSERTCDVSNNGYEYWERSYSESTSIVTYPPAAISGALQGCTLYNGWCNTNPTLALSAMEPVSGYNITNIEGTRNGTAFTCPAGTGCSQSLVQGNNTFSYWAHSTFGDTSGSSTLSAKVDSVPPTVSNMVNGTAGTNGWYISDVTVSASGTDVTSGVASAQVSVDGGAWQVSASLTDGTYTVMSRTMDKAGNTAATTRMVSVDTLAPSVNPMIPVTDGSDGWVRTAPAIVSAEGADAGSGLASVLVSVDNGLWQPSASLADGIHTVQFKSVDLAGNSTIVTRTVKVDVTAPFLTASTVGTSGNAGWYISQAITTIATSDPASGVARVEHSYNSGNWQPGTSITSLDGVNTLDVRVYDLAGNVTQNSFTIKVDTIQPLLQAVAPHPDGMNGWVISAPAAVSAAGQDAGSGLASAQVSVDNGPWQSSLSLSDGIHTVQFRATDQAGNASTAARTIKVDATSPSLSFASDGAHGKAGWYVSQVSTTILSRDDTSGVSSIQYSQNNAPWEEGSSFNSSDGLNTIHVRVSDVAGNVSADTLQIKVDTAAPSISTSTRGTEGISGWFISQTTTSFLPDDRTSGVDHVEYSQNGSGWQTGTAVESQDGINSIVVKAYDQAGNVSADTLQVKVDSGRPSSTFISPLNGSGNHLARGIFSVSGSSTDAVSGVSSADLSFDQGLTWAPLALVDGTWTYDLNTGMLEDGVHRVVVRTTDLAGNIDSPETSTAFIDLDINNHPPRINLTPEWLIWQSGSLSINAGYFPLKSGKVTISDPQHRWPEIKRAFGKDYPESIKWDRYFANGFLAPSGNYDVSVTACNIYNLCSDKTAVIKIPWIAMIIPAPPPTAPAAVNPQEPVVEGIPERPSIRPTASVESSPVPELKQHNTAGQTPPPTSVHTALALVTLITLLWAVASASLSDRRPTAINAITNIFSDNE